MWRLRLLDVFKTDPPESLYGHADAKMPIASFEWAGGRAFEGKLLTTVADLSTSRVARVGDPLVQVYPSIVSRD